MPRNIIHLNARANECAYALAPVRLKLRSHQRRASLSRSMQVHIYESYYETLTRSTEPFNIYACSSPVWLPYIVPVCLYYIYTTSMPSMHQYLCEQ